MASYTSPTLSGYNASPPPDDGSETGANEVKWSTIKEKLPDPLKTYAEAIDSAVTTAFTTTDADIVTLDGRVDVIETDSNKYDEDEGIAANAYVVTLSPAPASYTGGLVVRIRIANSNTLASTLNVNGLGAIAIKQNSGDDVYGGMLRQNGIYTLVYDATSAVFRLQETTSRANFATLATGEPAVSTTILTLTDSDITSGTWEGVGPTGTSEPNVWTALDNIPLEVDWIEVFIGLNVSTTTAPSTVAGAWFARDNGSTAAQDNTTLIATTESTITGAGTNNSEVGTTAKIQLTSKEFDLGATYSASTTMTTVFRLVGWGYNG